jgi:hypothetical protein
MGLEVNGYDNIQFLNNVISGNGIDSPDAYAPGLVLGQGAFDAGPMTNVVFKGNKIGTNILGTAAVPNFADGIFAGRVVNGLTIGGPNPGDGNVISGNGSNGININYHVSNVSIQGNMIGMNSDGTGTIGNTGGGISIDGYSSGLVSDITIGGLGAGEGNMIGGIMVSVLHLPIIH